MNSLSFAIYSGIGNTLRYDTNGDLRRARLQSFSTTFPKGLYVAMSLFIPRETAAPIWWNGGDRIVARNGLTIVWEGRITGTGFTINESDEGVEIQALGFYGDVLGKRSWAKVWADNRIGDDIWIWDTTIGGAKRATYDNLNRIRITPIETQWYATATAGLTYTMPTGETIKRVVMSYDFAEDGEGAVDFAKFNNDPGGTNTFADMTNSIDEDTSTHYNLTMTSDDYIYVGVRDLTAFAGVRVDLGTTVNSVSAAMSAQYYAAATDTTAAAWTGITLSDGTSSGGVTLAQDGDWTFTPPLPDDMEIVTVDGDRAYWFRFTPSANLTASVDVKELSRIDTTQDWTLRLRDTTGGTNVWAVSATGTGSQDLEAPGDFTARQSFQLQLVSNISQVPRADGSYYGQISSVMMYSEIDSAITAGVIAADVLTQASDVNSYTGLIGDPALTLEPFYTDGTEALASILERAIAYGDSSFNSWYIRLLESERAQSPDGKPVLEVAQWPALTDYDYIVSLTDRNLVGSIQFFQDYENIYNWIAVSYRDDKNNRDILLTPDDDSALKDSTSITDYGERHLETPLNVGVATSTMALNIGKRFLAANKDPKFYVSSPITVTGYIRGKAGNRIPASQIQAGKRLKIETYLDDLAGTTGAGLTQIITDTTYTENDGGEYCSINLEGVPDNLAIILAQRDGGFLSDGAKRKR